MASAAASSSATTEAEGQCAPGAAPRSMPREIDRALFTDADVSGRRGGLVARPRCAPASRAGAQGGEATTAILVSGRDADDLVDRLRLLEHMEHEMGDVGAWNGPAAAQVPSDRSPVGPGQWLVGQLRRS